MKIALISPLLLLGSAILVSQTYAATIAASQDAYISISSPTTTFGTTDPNQLQTSDGDAKAYIMFDASSYGATLLNNVDSLTVYSSFSNRARTLNFYLLEGTGVDGWDELTLTSNNAPLNDTSNDGFIAGAGETLTLLGSGGNSGDDLVPMTVTLAATEEAALLNALNTGDRKATMGVQLVGSAWTYLSSSERASGIYAPLLNNVTAVPELSSFGLISGLFALLFVQGRRRRN